MLCDEAGFLVDARAAKLVGALPATESGRVKADAVVRALGVTDGASFDALMAVLSTNSEPAQPPETPGASKRVDQGVLLLIDPKDAVKRLRAFVEANNLALNGSSRITGGKAARRDLAQGMTTILSVADREQQFWQHAASAIDDTVFRGWKALEGQMHEYHALLRNRSNNLKSVRSVMHILSFLWFCHVWGEVW